MECKTTIEKLKVEKDTLTHRSSASKHTMNQSLQQINQISQKCSLKEQMKLTSPMKNLN